MATSPAAEVTAISFATSGYEVPHACMAIGLDRVYDDRAEPMTDRSRSSITRGEAGGLGIGFEREDDMAYWWSTNSYFTDETLEGTRRVVERHNNLKTAALQACSTRIRTSPGTALSSSCWLRWPRPRSSATWWKGAGGGWRAAGQAGLLLPFPLNILSWAIAAAGVTMALKGVINLVVDLFKSGVRIVEEIFGDEEEDTCLPGADGDKAWNSSSRSTKAPREQGDMVHYSNGDALLGSVQNHLKGKIAFQKSAWQATIDCEAAVWTGTPPSNIGRLLRGDAGLQPASMAQFFKDLFQLQPVTAIAEHAIPFLRQPLRPRRPQLLDGEFALPMVVQHESAAIIAYNIPTGSGR